MSARGFRFLLSIRAVKRKGRNVVCKDGSSWLDVIDDAGVLVRRLEILENLLRKCTFDMPRTECKFVDDTAEGYDGSEMLQFLDESLLELIEGYRTQIEKYKVASKRGQTDFGTSTSLGRKKSRIPAIQIDKAA